MLCPFFPGVGGTSLAGQCTNVAVVVDWSKHCTVVESIDVDRRVAIVEPGIVLDELNRALEGHGLMFGPKLSTHASCTIGGMIGNNSCGSTAQAYGTTADNVEALEILTYDGLRAWVGLTDDAEYDRVLARGGRQGELYRGLRELREDSLAAIRTSFPDIPRRSGYNLPALLPEQAFHVARALVGSESTLVTVLRAKLRLVARQPARALVVLGYPDITAAADAVPVAAHHPLALEGLDDRLIELEHSQHLARKALGLLPGGAGWLMVQFAGDSDSEVRERAQALIDELSSAVDAPTVAYLTGPIARTFSGRRVSRGSARRHTRRAAAKRTRDGRTRRCRPSGLAAT